MAQSCYRIYGTAVDVGAIVSGNTAYRNGNTGISTSTGSTISNNTAYDNGGHGILTSSGCLVKGNAVRGNTGYGLYLQGTASGYIGNVITANTEGTVFSIGQVNLGNNACNGSTTCP